MNNSIQKITTSVFMTFAIILISQISALASTNNTAVDDSLSASKVVGFFVLLLVVIIAPAFRKSIHARINHTN